MSMHNDEAVAIAVAAISILRHGLEKRTVREKRRYLLKALDLVEVDGFKWTEVSYELFQEFDELLDKLYYETV